MSSLKSPNAFCLLPSCPTSVEIGVLKLLSVTISGLCKGNIPIVLGVGGHWALSLSALYSLVHNESPPDAGVTNVICIGLKLEII